MNKRILAGAVLAILVLLFALAFQIREVQRPSIHETPSAHELVTSRPTPPASPTFNHRFLRRNSDGSPVRWNPCEPIRYVLNPLGSPDGVVADLEAAISRITEASGLSFLFEGTTDEIPEKPRDVYQVGRYGDRWAPVLVAWVPGSENKVGVLPDEAGRSSPVAVELDALKLVNISGHLFLNSEAQYPQGFGQSRSWGHVLLHELGHLVGLDHVNDPTQVMHQELGEGAVKLGAGDLIGLEVLGRESGCLPNPHPRPVEIIHTN